MAESSLATPTEELRSLAEDAATAWDPGQSACPPVGNVPSWAMS